MDPISAAALAALAGGLGGEAGRQAWQGLTTLVRRPFRRGEAGPDEAGPGTGEIEVASLQEAPGEPMRAQALVTALGVRAALDAEFGSALATWWREAQAVDTGGQVHNEISGGRQETVVQGRDFSNLTFNVRSDPAN
ncbi:hypothetical protein [Streptomyces sp. NPDC046887]|uniref:hypothetical protein n=1 Tax=Streptomyces sp. NPDC046887 TaxID=3155472 RepID=UPI0033F3A927